MSLFGGQSNGALLDALKTLNDVDEMRERAEQAERERDELKRLIADNARDESGRVSMPLAGLRKLDEARAARDEAYRERDEASVAVANALVSADEAIARAEAAERRVEALVKYTRHKPLCDAIWSTEETPCPCSCGLAQALDVALAAVKP